MGGEHAELRDPQIPPKHLATAVSTEKRSRSAREATPATAQNAVAPHSHYARATRSNSPGLVVWAPCGGAWPVVPRYKPRSSRFAAVFRETRWSTKIRPFFAKNRFSQRQGARSAANGGYGGAPRKL